MSIKQEIAELRNKLDELEQRLDPLPNYVAVGGVVRFHKQYERNGKWYAYVAIKAKLATWYLTGREHHSLTDGQFREFLKDASNVELATSWERLDER